MVEITPELHRTVTDYAHVNDTTRKAVVVTALEEYLNKRSFTTDDGHTRRLRKSSTSGEGKQ